MKLVLSFTTTKHNNPKSKNLVKGHEYTLVRGFYVHKTVQGHRRETTDVDCVLWIIVISLLSLFSFLISSLEQRNFVTLFPNARQKYEKTFEQLPKTTSALTWKGLGGIWSLNFLGKSIQYGLKTKTLIADKSFYVILFEKRIHRQRSDSAQMWRLSLHLYSVYKSRAHTKRNTEKNSSTTLISFSLWFMKNFYTTPF